MSDASKPAVGQRDLIEEETLAENILKEEVNVGDDDPNDKVYWIRNFLQAMDMKKLYEVFLNFLGRGIPLQVFKLIKLNDTGVAENSP